MKKLILVLAVGTLMAEEPQEPSAGKLDAAKALQIIQDFGKTTLTDMRNAPSSHIVAGTLGFVVAAVLCKRFSGVSRLNKKVDELTRFMKESKK
jgi:hypothetical protein